MTSSGTTPPGAETPRSPAGCFVTTHWSVVLTAARNDTLRSQAALEKLCRAYWYPLYAYARRCGHSVEDAQDLTQEFFARVLERQWLARADRAQAGRRTAQHPDSIRYGGDALRR
jgi:RNA polymerase sigma-70 factor (ECF subfamily)